eukprot:scaffold219930_cov18-Tisochrysis_lutea.AAC.1
MHWALSFVLQKGQFVTIGPPPRMTCTGISQGAVMAGFSLGILGCEHVPVARALTHTHTCSSDTYANGPIDELACVAMLYFNSYCWRAHTEDNHWVVVCLISASFIDHSSQAKPLPHHQGATCILLTRACTTLHAEHDPALRALQGLTLIALQRRRSSCHKRACLVVPVFPQFHQALRQELKQLESDALGLERVVLSHLQETHSEDLQQHHHHHHQCSHQHSHHHHHQQQQQQQQQVVLQNWYRGEPVSGAAAGCRPLHTANGGLNVGGGGAGGDGGAGDSKLSSMGSGMCGYISRLPWRVAAAMQALDGRFQFLWGIYKCVWGWAGNGSVC